MSNPTTPEERAALRAAVTCKPDSVEEAWACVRVLKDLAPRLADDVDRLLRGDFTPDEFQGLCHHRDENPSCTPGAFCDGCHEYQRKLFGRSERDAATYLVGDLMAEKQQLREDVDRLERERGNFAASLRTVMSLHESHTAKLAAALGVPDAGILDLVDVAAEQRATVTRLEAALRQVRDVVQESANGLHLTIRQSGPTGYFYFVHDDKQCHVCKAAAALTAINTALTPEQRERLGLSA